ncbi:hypothetical protein XELAEV_18015016mg [Xenopus laevis]|uniref:Uncharacterized protein n=1 Tax=Xenopus laevis TaxID=8355 RepID=A0A974DH74_XENLA|nr:hypothetical protein XELAEV_18015016mg [Xenopus laevis]
MLMYGIYIDAPLQRQAKAPLCKNVFLKLNSFPSDNNIYQREKEYPTFTYILSIPYCLVLLFHTLEPTEILFA